MRTNVELDARLITEFMRRYRLKTKREAVDLALRRLVDEPLDAAQALALEGSGWHADLGELGESRRAASGSWSIRRPGSNSYAAPAVR